MLAAVLLVSAAVVGAVSLVDSPSLPSESADLLAGAGACLALFWALTEPRRDPIR